MFSLKKVCHYVILFGAVFSIFSIYSCKKRNVEVEVKVQVKNNQGKPIANAQILLEQQLEGMTNSNGYYSVTKLFETDKKVNLEVKKESKDFYFAPYFDSFTVLNKDKQSITVNAIMYYVPKPSDEDALVAIEDGLGADKRESDNHNIHTTNNEREVKNSLNSDLKETKDNKEQLHSLSENGLSPNTKLTREGGVSDQLEKPVSKNRKQDLSDVKLNKIIDEKYSFIPKSLEYPWMQPKKDSSVTLFTIHVYSKSAPIVGATVYFGEEKRGTLNEACQTNKRGRCVVRFKNKPNNTLFFVAKKGGYQTKTLGTRVTHKGNIRFILQPGNTIDIFTITKTYNNVRGLAGIDIYISGKKVGVSDKFGHFSYLYKGEKDDLLEVKLVTKKYLPEKYLTDFVVSGPMSLVKYFTPKEPPKVKTALLNIQPTGKINEYDAKFLGQSINGRLLKATRLHLFKKGAFEEVAISEVERVVDGLGMTLTKIAKDGWENTPLKAYCDVLLLPTLVLQEPKVLELSLIDSKGKIIAAAKERLHNIKDMKAIMMALKVISKRIARVFPFEGAIVGRDKNVYFMNLSYSEGRIIEIGDKLDVYGVQHDKLGQQRLHTKIGILKVFGSSDRKSKLSLVKLKPRAVINIGDLVVLKGRKVFSNKTTQIRVTGLVGDQEIPVSQANIYFRDNWIGSSDKHGRLLIDKQMVGNSSGILRVVKHGYRDFAKEFRFASLKKVEVKLIRETAFIKIESDPPGASIRIDNKIVGKTPLASPIEVQSGFVKLVLFGLYGYKKFSTILELDQGTLDLTGARRIGLERDLLQNARHILDNGKVEEALEALLKVPETHSDYLLAQHQVGEIYLTIIGKPALAAKHFSVVTKSPRAENFNDKRYIGSHINEGIALFHTGKALENKEPQVALAHYLKAIQIFEKVSPFLRFISKNQHSIAKNNVSYYKALSFHKMWSLTKNPQYLNRAYRLWRHYLEDTAMNADRGKGKSNYVENAKIYFRQLKASMNLSTNRQEKL